MILTRGKQNLTEDPVPVTILQPQSLHGFAKDRTGASASNTKEFWNYVHIPYRAVNTLRFGYKNQSVSSV